MSAGFNIISYSAVTTRITINNVTGKFFQSFLNLNQSYTDLSLFWCKFKHSLSTKSLFKNFNINNTNMNKAARITIDLTTLMHGIPKCSGTL